MKSVKDQIIDAFGDTTKIHVTEEIMEFLEQLKVKEPDTLEIGMVASIISQHLFDDLRKYYNEGSMFCHDAIAQIAEDFVEKFGHVEEWEEYLANNVFVTLKDGEIKPVKPDDWEDFVLKFAWLTKDQYVK